MSVVEYPVNRWEGRRWKEEKEVGAEVEVGKVEEDYGGWRWSRGGRKCLRCRRSSHFRSHLIHREKLLLILLVTTDSRRQLLDSLPPHSFSHSR